MADAVLGSALGLFVSAFAQTEFQAVQFLPLIVFPQILLCGLFVPREALPPVLEAVSNVLPLSYAVDAMTHLTRGTDTSTVWTDLARRGGVRARRARPGGGDPASAYALEVRGRSLSPWRCWPDRCSC